MKDIKSILEEKVDRKKPPAYEWQDLALKIIKDLNVPDFKKSSIFKVCRDSNKTKIMSALTDTKELCNSGQKWKYFLKVMTSKQ